MDLSSIHLNILAVIAAAVGVLVSFWGRVGIIAGGMISIGVLVWVFMDGGLRSAFAVLGLMVFTSTILAGASQKQARGAS